MYTEESLSRLIDQVEKEFTSHLAKAEEEFRLAKAEGAEDDSKKKPEASKEKSEKPEATSEEKTEGKEAAPAASEPAESSEKPADAPAPAADPAAAAPAGGSGYDAEDLSHLQEMYSSMSRDELMAHHDAVKMALDAMAAPAAPEAAPAAPGASSPAAPAEATPPAAEAAPAEQAPFQKSEDLLLKSEIEGLKAKNDELKKQFETVAQALVQFVSKKAPAAKAITSVETVAKSEATLPELTLTRPQIDQILKKKAAEVALQKSDRELINAFYLNKGTSIDSIRHLLK